MHLKKTIKLVRQGQGAEIAALQLNRARESLELIIGRISSAEVLQCIFSQFCIGK